MGFGVFKSPQENFENYKNKYAKQNQLISRGDLNGINQILNGDWAKQQPWYEAYQMARVQDFSKFEQIDPLVRSFLATVFMNRLMLVEASSKRIPETDPNAKNQPLPDFSVPPLGLHLSANANEISDELKTFMRENKHNPLFRLGCSMLSRPNETAVRTKAQIQADKRKADRFREIDDQMTEMIMEDTLRPMSEMQIRNARMMAGSQEAADELIQTNIEKQVTVAKTLFLTHIGKTFITTSTLNEKGEIVSTKQENLQRSVASMVSHCSRTGFVLPPGQTADVNEMMESILGSNTGKSSGIYGRFAATHSTENGRSVKEYKEAKGICLRKQYGMDLAIGGFLNPGVMGADYKKQLLKNDGSSGHMYLHINKGEPGQTSSILMGFESDAPQKTNQMGHTHNSKAAPESMSSFLGQRDDEMGDKYGGRTVDCTMYDANTLKDMVDSFAGHYRSMLHEAVKNGTVKRSLEEANKMLSGTLMSPDELETFFNKTGFTKKEAGKMAITVAERRNLWERSAIDAKRAQVNALSDSEKDIAIKPMEELKKPGRRVRIKAAFGSKRAKEIINTYKKRFVKRTEKVRMTFRDLDERERASSNKPKNKERQQVERKIQKQESLKEYSTRNPKGK